MRALIAAAVCVAVLGGCASTGAGQRTKLTTAELKQIGPELVDHRKCVIDKVKGYLGGTTSVSFMVDTAIKNCRHKLIAVSQGLDQFNLRPTSKRSYLKAVETSTRNKVNEALLKASAKAGQRKREAAKRETLQL